MAEMKSKVFKRKWEAQKFIEEIGKGYYEGPFYDERMNPIYYVFWSENDTQTMWDVKFSDGSLTRVRVEGKNVTLTRCIEILRNRGMDIDDIVSLQAKEEPIC